MFWRPPNKVLIWLFQFLVICTAVWFFIAPQYRNSKESFEEKKIPWSEYTLEAEGESSSQLLPPSDQALKAWAEKHARGRIWLEREVTEEKTKVILTFKHLGAVTAPPWGKLGYSRNQFGTTSSGMSWSEAGRLLPARVWIWRGWLVAMIGFLGFGAFSWSRREKSSGLVSSGRALAWGVGLGLVAAMLGWLVSLVQQWGLYPQTLPWIVEFIEADSTAVLILFCLLGTLLVPLAQQLFFRDLQQRCMDAGCPGLGALVSSAIPALVLITLPLAALIMFLTELAACVLFQRTRHLLAPIVLSMVAGALGFGLLWHAEADTPKWSLQSQGQSSDALRQGLESLRR